MSIHLFTRLRKIFCQLLLLALFATLLPAYHVSAAEQVVVIPKDKVSESLWRSVWKQQGAGEYYYGITARMEEAFYVVGGGHPAVRADLALLRGRVNVQTNQWTNDKKRVSYKHVANTIFEMTIDYPALAGTTKEVWTKLGDPNFSSTIAVPDLRQAIAYDHELEFRQRIDDFGLEIWNKAKADPQYAADFDKRHEAGLGVKLKDFDGKAYIDANPDAPAARKIRSKVRSDGSIAISLNELKDLAKTEFGNINTSIGELRETITEIDARQQDLVDFMQDEQARQEAQAKAEAASRDYKETIEAADSAITTISRLVGFLDADTGRAIDVIASSMLEIGDSLNSWSKAIAGLNTLDALTSANTVVMIGNVIGAALNIISLFGEAAPTPDQMILEQIGKLREQVNELRTEMHDRFDKIDKDLNTIYTTMQDRFDKIDIQLGKINGSLAEIQRTLVDLDIKLDRMERNNFEFFDTIGRRPLLNAINGAVGYRKRTGLDMPYQPEFVTFENDFNTWATVNAYDALSAGPTQRDYSDSQVLAELSNYPLDANLNYLNGWLISKGMQPFASKRLAGSRDWLYASRAYTRTYL